MQKSEGFAARALLRADPVVAVDVHFVWGVFGQLRNLAPPFPSPYVVPDRSELSSATVLHVPASSYRSASWSSISVSFRDVTFRVRNKCGTRDYL